MGIRSSLPRVSVVVNTYNRAKSLHQTLLGMRRQNYPNFEVIVVNGPSTEETNEVLRWHFAEIRVGSCAQRNLSTSRNVGIEMARGEFVAFIDDDAVPDFCYPGCHLFPALLGTNSIFRRSALLEVGGFDEQFDYFPDETDVNVRLIDAGYVLKQIPRAFVYHCYLPSHIRNEKRVNTNYASMIRNRIYFSLKNASLADGQSAERLKDWAALCRDAIYNVNWNISRGTIQADVLERLRVDMDASVEEGIQLGMNRPRRLMSSAIAKEMRGVVAYDLDLPAGESASEPREFKRCPILLAASEKLTVALLS
jgi:glycogen synthase